MGRFDYINFNGELLSSQNPFLKDNRAFRYGDSLFETIRVINGSVYNLENHMNRLLSGAKLLSYDIPSHYTIDFFRAEIGKLIQRSGIEEGAKIRLHLFRSGNGTYKGETNDVDYLVTAESLDHNLFKLNTEGVSMEIFGEVKKEKNILSNLKTGNALIYVMAMNFAKKKGFDDVFIMNTNGDIIEAAQSNIFLVSNGVLYTPPLSDGCVGGTMRMKLINLALEKKITIYESSITPQNILVADEIILTNAVQGVQWVGAFRGKRYYNKMAKNFVNYLNGVDEPSSMKGLQENLQLP